ncbi:MAG TPA: magnesium/cobalt transporter CorA [Anaerolineaceae bacterium]|nr:magnesium/cobalt transporter CorA [Anaerolineaceae bacterium]
MIETICIPARGNHPVELSIAEVPAVLRHPDDLIWVDLAGPSEEELLQVLRDVFHFHPLAIEDCLSGVNQPSKIDDFGSYLFIIVHAIDPEHEFPLPLTNELNIFLGSNFLITSHFKKEISPVTAIKERLKKDERLVQNGADFLCHAVLDHLVDEYGPLIENIEAEVEMLEDRVLDRPSPQTLQRLLSLKHGVLSSYRAIGPLLITINRLSRDPFAVVDVQSRIYFRDIYDHLNRLESGIDLIREMISSAQEIYLNSTSLRLNEVMKALTIVSTIFLPLSFVAGVYGMNFRYMPELNWPYGYFLAWGIFLLITVSMVAFFKRRGWF